MINLNDATAVKLLHNYFINLSQKKLKNLVNILVASSEDQVSIDLLLSSINAPDKVTCERNDIIYEIHKKYLINIKDIYLNTQVKDYHQEKNTYVDIHGEKHIPVKLQSFLPFSPGNVLITDGKYLKTKIYIGSLKEITEDLISSAFTHIEVDDDLSPFVKILKSS